MGEEEDFDFDKRAKDFNTDPIVLVEMAKVVAPLYLAFVAQGLNDKQAAELTVKIIMSYPAPPPPRGE